MGWAARRRFIILLIIGAVIAAFLAIVLIATFYKTPTCTDGIQNQNEVGIDCGGSCRYLCTTQEQPPTVLFTKVLVNSASRADVVALVENKNTNAAAKNVPYRITLFGANHVFVQEIEGTLDLPPGAIVPVYVPGVSYGKQKVTQAFLEVDASAPQWFIMFSGSRVVPIVSNTTKSGSASEPRIEAILVNPSATIMTNVQTIALVYDAHKDVIAVSRTIVISIPGQGQAVATFTWNNAFSSVPALIEVVPIIPLP